jgi:hypothetical protein
MVIENLETASEVEGDASLLFRASSFPVAIPASVCVR